MHEFIKKPLKRFRFRCDL